MRDLMELVQYSFYKKTKWDLDNSYAALTQTAQSLLFFDQPRGLRMHVSSLASPKFASSYDFGSSGIINGSLSYLYSSVPLPIDASSETLDIRAAVPGYRHVQDLASPEKPWAWNSWQHGLRVDRKDTLLYGRMYLPGSRLEALYLRRLSPLQQLKISCVSDAGLPNGGSVLALLQSDHGKYSTDYLISSDSLLLGVRGLYNFGPDPRGPDVIGGSDGPHGRFSAGAELYYGVRNKSGGMSTGLRFTTLPRHGGMPYTMTLTLNPLMGNMSSTYSVQAGRNLALCSQYDFNFYSYESDLRMGLELWRDKPKEDYEWARSKTSGSDSLGWAKRKLFGEETADMTGEVPETSGVLKVRWDRAWGLGLLWEGRLSSLLFSAGVSLDLQRREQIFKAVGAEVRFSSGGDSG